MWNFFVLLPNSPNLAKVFNEHQRQHPTDKMPKDIAEGLAKMDTQTGKLIRFLKFVRSHAGDMTFNAMDGATDIFEASEVFYAQLHAEAIRSAHSNKGTADGLRAFGAKLNATQDAFRDEQFILDTNGAKHVVQDDWVEYYPSLKR